MKFGFWQILLMFLFLIFSAPGQKLRANIYGDADKHALSISGKQDNVLQLTRQLVEPFRNPEDKIRAIYRWITANIEYDMDAFNARRMGNLSPRDILSSGECICGGYANLFKIMANIAGFEAEIIIGYSKGYAYNAEKLFEENNQHAWNVVKVNGEWRLIDATWGAGYINDEQQFVAAFNNYYFFTPPEQLITTHFPHVAQWQLLREKRIRDDFANSAYTRPAFYHYGLSVMSHPYYHVQTGNQLRVKLSVDPDILLIARLFLQNEKLNENLTFCQKRGNIAEVDVLFPHEGKYTLRLFARRTAAGGFYEWIMDYAVDVSEGQNALAAFPEMFTPFVEKDVYLYTPMRRYLQPGHLNKFLVKITGAQRAAIIADGRFHLLKSAGKQLFSGAVTIPSGEVFLAAQYPGSDHFDYLLKFEGREF